jgi:hypothetical protein
MQNKCFRYVETSSENGEENEMNMTQRQRRKLKKRGVK